MLGRSGPRPSETVSPMLCPTIDDHPPPWGCRRLGGEGVGGCAR